jgi:hypothetical protein
MVGDLGSESGEDEDEGKGEKNSEGEQESVLKPGEVRRSDTWDRWMKDGCDHRSHES